MSNYEMVMFWLSLYPHEFGDEFLKEVMEAND